MPESKVKYNSETNTTFVSILKPYFTVGRELGWDSKVGLGIDNDIMRRVTGRKSLLCVYVDEWQSTHWLTYDNLITFMQNNEYQGKNQTKDVVYLPVKIFSKTKPEDVT